VHQELCHEDLDRIGRATTRRPLPRPPGLSIKSIQDFAEIRSELDELAAATGNLFWTSDWIMLWWQHFGDDHRLATYVCRDQAGAPVAILPLHFSRGFPLRVLRFVGHTVSDEMGPIARLRDRPAAIEALRSVLGQLDFEVFLAERLPADERWRSGLGGQRLRWTDSPVLHFGDQSWEKVTAAWSANFRQQVGRKFRKLNREHEVVFRRTTDAAKLDADLDTLFALHEARWSDESSFGGETAPFHRDFAHRALANGWLRLWILDLDGRPAAAWYGFRFGNAALYYQAGRDPERARESVGLMLLTHTVREALNDGATEYRFLEGTESYKYRLANAGSTLDTLAVAHGAVGVAAVAAGLLFGHTPKLTTVGHRIVR
jgi:CelD/BcsL family acetyltransferase involved in cellulose biosynthesis